MSSFQIDRDLEIGTVFEVTGNSIKLSLQRSVTELTRSYSGRVYDVGQIGSILKLHLGRKLLFATVRLLRLQTDEEAAAIVGSSGQVAASPEKRVIEADLLGEGVFSVAEGKLRFLRGVSTYPLPLQSAHLVTKEETQLLFESVESARDDGVKRFVEIGDYVGAVRVRCRADLDKLFGQHCAVLGSTGSGKSSAVASILHAMLAHDGGTGAIARPSVILIDPHGEYGASFGAQAKVFRAYNLLNQPNVGNTLSLPYWLMSGDEFRSLVIGKTEHEATSQANVVYKALAHARMVQAGLALSAAAPIGVLAADAHPEDPVPAAGIQPAAIAAFDRDRPLPFTLQEFTDHITKKQCMRRKGTNWERVTDTEYQDKYASILNKLRVLRADARVQFMMKEYVAGGPTLAAVLAQFVDIAAPLSPCLKILDISGLRNEVAGPLTGAVARLLFQYKLFQTREERERDPMVFVCEEAHRYVPNRGDAEYEIAQSAIRRIAREGRKYGLGLMLVSQRPADVEGTVISQCNSWIVLRLSNSSDQDHVTRFLPDSLAGMTKVLSSLPRQEALFVGEASAIPARIRLNTLAPDKLPNSNDISFAKGWSADQTTMQQLTNIATRMET